MDSRGQICTIIHPEYGVVERVSRGYECWHKNGAMYCQSRGWRQIPQLQWVDVTRECYIGKYGVIKHDNQLTQEYPYRRSMRDVHIIIEKEMMR